MIFDEKLMSARAAAKTTAQEVARLTASYLKLNIKRPTEIESEWPRRYYPINPALLTAPPPAYLLVHADRRSSFDGLRPLLARINIAPEVFETDRAQIIPNDLIKLRQENHDSCAARAYYDWRIKSHLSESAFQIYVPSPVTVATIELYEWKAEAQTLLQWPRNTNFVEMENWSRRICRFQSSYYNLAINYFAAVRTAGYELPEVSEFPTEGDTVPEFLAAFARDLEKIIEKVDEYLTEARKNYLAQNFPIDIPATPQPPS